MLTPSTQIRMGRHSKWQDNSELKYDAEKNEIYVYEFN